jgi:hypothetical protein
MVNYMNETTRRHHDAVQRAHEHIARADASLDQHAIDVASRPLDQPDALTRWCASMPAKPQPERVRPEEIRKMAAHHEANRQAMQDAATRAELHKFMHESRLYRDNLERALGKIISDQRAEVERLQAEIDELRGDTQSEPITLPALRLVGGQRD